MTESRLFDHPDRGLAGHWDRYLRLQADVTFDVERAVFEALPDWQRAGTVADLGTGNGAWLRRLVDAFPDKDYLGIDRSAALVQLAEAGPSRPNLRFAVGDLEARDWGDPGETGGGPGRGGRFDFLLLRTVVQYLGDPDLAALALHERMADGGSALVIDNAPAAARTAPAAPHTAAVYAAIARHLRARRRGAEADAVAPFLRAAGAVKGLTLVGDQVIAVPSTAPGKLGRFEKLTRAALDLFRAAGDVPADYDAAIDEWQEWCEEPVRYCQIGLRFLLFRRTGDPPRDA